MNINILVNNIADAIQKQEGWSKTSRSFRNNNPGNIWDGLTDTKKKRIWPNIPTDKDGFLVYPDYKTGRKALENDILIKVKRGMSLESLFYMYAPPKQDPKLEAIMHNDTEAYITNVMKSTNISDRKRKLLDLIDA